MDLDPYPMMTSVGRHSRTKFCEEDLECFFSPRKGYVQEEEQYGH